MRYLMSFIGVILFTACGSDPSINLDRFQGPQGPAGANGLDGKNGSDGSNGLDGSDGSDGSDGLSGLTSSTQMFCQKTDPEAVQIVKPTTIYSLEVTPFSSGDVFVSCSVYVQSGPSYYISNSVYYRAGRPGITTRTCKVYSSSSSGNAAPYWTFALNTQSHKYEVTLTHPGSPANGYVYTFVAAQDCSNY